MKQAVFIVSLLIVVALAGSAWWFWQDMQSYLRTPLQLDNDVIFTINPGDNLQSVGRDLRQAGWLSHPHYLILEAKRQGKDARIKAGEYLLRPGTTPLQLLDQFIEGKVIQYALTLVEGWTFREALAAIRDQEALVKTLDYNADDQAIMASLGYPETHPEGRFFPDTYHFPRGITDKQFLLRAFRRMEKVLSEEWENRVENLPYQSPYEALIMASIIEKETGVAHERGKIAGVFVRRLQKGMLLQTDPTVIYAMGTNYDGNIRKRDLSIDSPYNTYRYAGLPPTPIALPGRDAIHAALHPEEGSALYFVSKGDGSHHFSDTLREHNSAVNKYQLGE